ncbi:hypothetical protein KIN20_023379 [Parelaphostrongylus tenuis]|uniref:Uncharacterized protein n=1 Tax=Parelaphostrongylus tenuis TaxID=148309 RepID=A0AAD5N902_PARTN|nr:hypothetical protein KIN20_023379 [Parelaphostrongylus tenuis]
MEAVVQFAAAKFYSRSYIEIAMQITRATLRSISANRRLRNLRAEISPLSATCLSGDYWGSSGFDKVCRECSAAVL